MNGDGSALAAEVEEPPVPNSSSASRSGPTRRNNSPPRVDDGAEYRNLGPGAHHQTPISVKAGGDRAEAGGDEDGGEEAEASSEDLGKYHQLSIQVPSQPPSTKGSKSGSAARQEAATRDTGENKIERSSSQPPSRPATRASTRVAAAGASLNARSSSGRGTLATAVNNQAGGSRGRNGRGRVQSRGRVLRGHKAATEPSAISSDDVPCEEIRVVSRKGRVREQ